MLVEMDEPLYELVPASDKGSGGQPIRFSRLDWQPEEIVDATQKRGLHSSKSRQMKCIEVRLFFHRKTESCC